MLPVPEWFFNQSAVIPFRRTDDGIEVMLITTIRKKKWIIPKGVVEPGLSPRDSAAAEAFEEAGVHGHVLPEKVGEYRYRKWGGECAVSVYLMEVGEMCADWPERDMRDRRWMGVDEAAGLVKEPALKPIIRNLPAFIARASSA